MNPNFAHPTATGSWRDIRQQVKPRTMPAEGRRRLVVATLRPVAVVALAAALGWGVIAVTAELRETPRTVAALLNPPVLRHTDGVLGAAWLARALALPKNAALTSLDLAQLQRRLLASGQVRAATLTKNFPATLTVSLTERSPVARVIAPDGALLLVARDGVAYLGEGYPPALTESLPWVEGAPAAQAGAPLAGAEAVAELLATAQLEAPQLYEGWRAVSLARLTSDGELVVRTAAGPRAVFNVRDTFRGQLAELDHVWDRLAALPQPPEAINLALGRDVVVTPGSLLLAAAAPVSARAARPAPDASPFVRVYKILPSN